METIIIIGGYEQIHCILLLLALLSELIFLFVLFLYFHLKKNLSGYIFFFLCNNGTLFESFYSVKYGQSIIRSNVCQIISVMDYERPVRKSPSLYGQKSYPDSKFLGTAEAYFFCHISSDFQISLIYAFIGCPQSVNQLAET